LRLSLRLSPTSSAFLPCIVAVTRDCVHGLGQSARGGDAPAQVDDFSLELRFALQKRGGARFRGGIARGRNPQPCDPPVLPPREGSRGNKGRA